METAVHRNDKEDRLYIYVEGYVLPYLQEELQKEEDLRIYLYGRRAVNRYEIYGAGREREIAQFGGYTLLEELECRAEAADLVFFLTQKEKRIEIRSYEVFYQRNEGMQNYLLETQKADKRSRTSDLPEQKEEKRLEGKKRKQSGGWFTVQLTALFLLLTAIVITSTDSYDKLSRLGKSAKDVMFTVENRAAQSEAEPEENFSASATQFEAESEQEPSVSAKQTETESEQNLSASAAQSEEETEQNPSASAAQPEEETEQNLSGSAAQPEEETEQNLSGSAAQPEEETEQNLSGSAAQPEEETEQNLSDSAVQPEEETEQNLSGSAVQPEAEEALSRNLTRYYEVKKGDTLYTICREVYGDLSKVKKVCELNHIENPDEIGYGQRLILP